MRTMLAAVFEKSSDPLLPRKYLAVAAKGLSRWYPFIKLSLPKSHTYLTLDSEAVDVLKSFLNLYGYRFLGVVELRSGDPFYDVFIDLLMEKDVRRFKRLLLSYIVSAADLKSGELVVGREDVEEFIQVNRVDRGIVEKVSRSVKDLVVLAVDAKNLRREAVYAFGYPVFRRGQYYVIPLRRAAVAGSWRWGIEAGDVRRAAEQIRKSCSNSTTLEEFEKCSEGVARRYHAMWRKLLKAVKSYPLYIELYAKALVKEFEKLGAVVQGCELWRVRLIL